MKFNFFFIYYSVIYAKYNYCYDVPKDMPTRYFDGKEWKIMKSRNSFRTKAPKHLNFISNEIDWDNVITEIKNNELDDSISDNSRYFIRTRSTNMFMTTSTPYYLMNTKTPAKMRKITIKQNLPCKLHKKITTTTIKPDMRKIENNDWTFIRPTIKSPAITRTTKELVSSRISTQVSGAQGKAVSENWSNLMKEFIKFVELKKCNPPPCIPQSTTKGNLLLPTDYRRTMMSHDDDLMNILIDGVQIDDGLIEDGADNNQNRLVTSEEALEDQSQILDFESDESFIDDYVQDFSGDNEDVELKSNFDAVQATSKQRDKTTLTRKNEAFLEESKSTNVKKDSKVPPIKNSEEYFDDFKQKNAPKSDEIVHDREIKSYLKALLHKHVRNEHVPAKDGKIKTKYENNERNKVENDLYSKSNENNLVDFSKNTLNSKEFNEVSESMEIIKNQTNDGDVYQDSDITIDSDFLEDDNVEADR